MIENIEDYVKGAFVGLLIGDALGYPYRDLHDNMPKDIDMVSDLDGTPPGTYTSFGSMALCITDSIVNCKRIDTDDIIDAYYEMYIGGHLTSHEEALVLPETTSQALKHFSNGMPADKCGLTDEESNTNDCLSSVLPVALFYATETIDNLIDAVHTVCSITHKHERSQVCCALFALIVRNIFMQKAEKATIVLEDYYKTKQLDYHIQELESVLGCQNSAENNEYVQDCFWLAWSSFAKYEDFELSVIDAVRTGHDANAVGAVAGCLTGLSKGLSDIPERWMQKLQLKSDGMSVISKFVKLIDN